MVSDEVDTLELCNLRVLSNCPLEFHRCVATLLGFWAAMTEEPYGMSVSEDKTIKCTDVFAEFGHVCSYGYPELNGDPAVVAVNCRYYSDTECSKLRPEVFADFCNETGRELRERWDRIYKEEQEKKSNKL